MKPRTFTAIALVLALTFWMLESYLHVFLFHHKVFEYIPSDMNELWMRIVIVILILLIGLIADYFVQRTHKKRLEVANSYHEMLSTSRHILTNLVTQMQMFKLEAVKCEDFNQDIIKYYDNSMKDASNLVETLSRVEKLLDEAEYSS